MGAASASSTTLDDVGLAIAAHVNQLEDIGERRVGKLHVAQEDANVFSGLVKEAGLRGRVRVGEWRGLTVQREIACRGAVLAERP
jgi:hypothetical protein